MLQTVTSRLLDQTTGNLFSTSISQDRALGLNLLFLFELLGPPKRNKVPCKLHRTLSLCHASLCLNTGDFDMLVLTAYYQCHRLEHYLPTLVTLFRDFNLEHISNGNG